MINSKTPWICSFFHLGISYLRQTGSWSSTEKPSCYMYFGVCIHTLSKVNHASLTHIDSKISQQILQWEGGGGVVGEGEGSNGFICLCKILPTYCIGYHFITTPSKFPFRTKVFDREYKQFCCISLADNDRYPQWRGGSGGGGAEVTPVRGVWQHRVPRFPHGEPRPPGLHQHIWGHLPVSVTASTYPRPPTSKRKGPFIPSVSINSTTMLRWRLRFCFIENSGVAWKWVANPIWSDSIVINENRIASVVAALMQSWHWHLV